MDLRQAPAGWTNRKLLRRAVKLCQKDTAGRSILSLSE
jgi:hypothetical protein